MIYKFSEVYFGLLRIFMEFYQLMLSFSGVLPLNGTFIQLKIKLKSDKPRQFLVNYIKQTVLGVRDKFLEDSVLKKIKVERRKVGRKEGKFFNSLIFFLNSLKPKLSSNYLIVINISVNWTTFSKWLKQFKRH
jgi:hypothetical protein